MAPEALATVLILASAMLHAIVNALVKISDDGLLTRGCMNAVAFFIALPFITVVPLPDASLWMILIAAMLVHGLYPFFLAGAYRHSDLSVAFPVARGITPLGVVLLAWLVLGSTLSTGKLLGICLLSAGIAAFALERFHPSDPGHRKGFALAVCTGCIVATYTVLDGIGLKTAYDPNTYIVWLFVLDGLFVSSIVTLARRHSVVPFLRKNWRKGLLGGVLGVLTYGLALYALSLGSLVEIAALRETSVVFAALIGAFLLKESFGTLRATATVLVMVAIMTIKISP
ncbi:MAG: DMT family transporter [Bryobacteraceae bacterium]|nr:DMT family transporter [Bryobacteraceae bacterium]